MPLAETEAVLSKLSKTENDSVDDRIRAHRVLPHSERERLNDELRSNGTTLRHMKEYKEPSGSKEIKKRERAIKQKILRESPTEISGAAKDELANELDRLLQDEIVPKMLTKEVLRRNPPGAVADLIKGEMSPPYKRAVHKFRNIKRTIEPDNDDPDLTNLERYRPSQMTDGNSTFMGDAQIPGHHAMSPQAKENFPESMGRNVNSAFDQVCAAAAESGLEVVLRPVSGNGSAAPHPGETKEPVRKVCECGCGEEFKTRNQTKKFVNPEHRTAHAKRKEEEDRQAAADVKAQFAAGEKELPEEE